MSDFQSDLKRENSSKKHVELIVWIRRILGIHCHSEDKGISFKLQMFKLQLSIYFLVKISPRGLAIDENKDKSCT